MVIRSPLTWIARVVVWCDDLQSAVAVSPVPSPSPTFGSDLFEAGNWIMQNGLTNYGSPIEEVKSDGWGWNGERGHAAAHTAKLRHHPIVIQQIVFPFT